MDGEICPKMKFNLPNHHPTHPTPSSPPLQLDLGE